MKQDISSKWPKLIWSIVIIAAFTIYIDKRSGNGSNMLGVFGFFFLFWGMAFVAALIVFFLRLFRVVNRLSFFYIFTAVASLFLAACGLWLTKGYAPGFGYWILLYFVTLAVSVLMLIDIFVVEIPGFRSSEK